MRRIAVVASTFGVGGAETVTGNILRRLSRERYDVRLYFLHEAGVVGRDLFAEGFAGVERLCRRRRDILGGFRLAQCFRSFRPGLVWCLDHADAMWLGRGAALVTGVPAVVIASHSTGLIDARGRTRASFGWRERVLFEFATRLVAVSATHARYLRTVTGLSADRVETIENGIDLAHWPAVTPERRREARAALGLPAEDPVVVMVAGMRPEKAHDTLLRAVGLLKERRLRVLLAGDGPRRSALEDTAEALGIRDRVDFLGVRRDVARLLHAGDVVVLPSLAVVETLPLSLLEAMASGIPVVASRVGSVPELVIEGETGRLVAPGDAEELARAIAATLDDADGTRRRAALARRRVEERYAIERATARYERLFDELMTA
jgi:glycosyltransferase involved in cell wall biosynthesis